MRACELERHKATKRFCQSQSEAAKPNRCSLRAILLTCRPRGREDPRCAANVSADPEGTPARQLAFPVSRSNAGRHPPRAAHERSLKGWVGLGDPRAPGWGKAVPEHASSGDAAPAGQLRPSSDLVGRSMPDDGFRGLPAPKQHADARPVKPKCGRATRTLCDAPATLKLSTNTWACRRAHHPLLAGTLEIASHQQHRFRQWTPA